MTLRQRDDYYYYYGSDSGRCDRYSFADKLTKLFIGVVSADFFLTLVALLVWLVTLRETRRILRWYNFGLCLALYLLSVGLEIIDEVLYECHVLQDQAYIRMFIAPQFFYTISELILLGILLLPINNAFLVLVHRSNKIFKIAHYIILAILSCIALAYDAIYAQLQRTVFYGSSEKLADDNNKLSGAYDVLILATLLYIMVLFCVWLRAMPSHQVSTGSLKVWIPLLFFFAIGLMIIRLVNVFYIVIPARFEISFDEEAAIDVLRMLTTFGVKISIIGVAAFRGFGEWSAERVYQTTSDTFEPLGGHNDMHEVVRETA